jgi:hypothetical protein
MPKQKYERRTDAQYEIGYKRPPKHTQFKKGQSGNPRGRPRKKPEMPDARASLANALNERVAVNDNGKTRHLTKLDLLMLQAVNKAVTGNPGPMRLLFPILVKLSEASNPKAAEQPNGPSPEELSKELDDMLSVLLPDQVRPRETSRPERSQPEVAPDNDNTKPSRIAGKGSDE